jgi:hypothetical protein
VQSLTLTSSWQRFEFVFTLASLSGKTIGTGSNLEIDIVQPNADTGTSAWTLDITGVQLEVGDTATPFEHRSYSDQLQSCMRYYFKKISTSSETSMNFCQGQGFASQSAYFYFEHPVEMRTKPTLSTSIGLVGNFGALNSGGGGIAVSGLSLVTTWSSRWTSVLSVSSVAAGNFTAGQSTGLDAGALSGAFLSFDAEL